MFHPMTGKKTKLKIHWYQQHYSAPFGPVVEVACGQWEPVIYVDNINHITCLKCMDIATKPKSILE